MVPQIVAIRYCKRKKKRNPCSTFSVSRLFAAVCRISAYSCPSYTWLAFARFSFFLGQSTTKLPLKHGPKTTYFLALVKAKSRKNVPPAERLYRAPPAGRFLQPGGARGRGEAATGFGETTSALAGSSVLAYDTASTYWTYCTGWSYQGTALQNER